MAAVAGLNGGSAAEPAGPGTAPQDAADTGELEAAERPAAAEHLEAAEQLEAAERPAAGAGPAAGSESRPRGNLSPLAVAGLVVGIIALVGAAIGVLALLTHGFRPKTIVAYRPPAVFRLRPGECINSSPNGLSVTVTSCATPHDAEVFGVFSLPGSSWPGEATVRQQAGSGCASRIGGYLNPQLANAGLAQEYVYPDRSAWQAGVRTVVCEVRASGGRLVGTVRKPG